MPQPTIPRTVVLLRARKNAFVRGGRFVAAGQVAAVDADDVHAHVALGDFAPVPAGAIAEVHALLLPEEPAPPAPVRLRWVSGVSSRQFGGRSVHINDLLEVDPTTAAGLIFEGVAVPADDE